MTVMTSMDKQRELQQQIPPTLFPGVNEDGYKDSLHIKVMLFPPKAISSLFLSYLNHFIQSVSHTATLHSLTFTYQSIHSDAPIIKPDILLYISLNSHKCAVTE